MNNLNNQPFSSSQRLVEAAEEAHHQHEDNPDLQVRFVPGKRKEKKGKEKRKWEHKNLTCHCVRPG